jgi:hypothetical protein
MPPTGRPTPERPTTARSDVARAWALSLAAGWAVLAVVSGLAIALDWHGVRDALDLGRLAR